MAEMILVGVVAQAAYTPTQQFWLDMSDRWLPFLFLAAGLIGTYLKLRSVEKGINGRMTQLIDSTRTAAKAEGKLEGVTEVAPQVVEALKPAEPVHVEVHVPPPDAQVGGKRRTDPPAPTPDPTAPPS